MTQDGWPAGKPTMKTGTGPMNRMRATVLGLLFGVALSIFVTPSSSRFKPDGWWDAWWHESFTATSLPAQLKRYPAPWRLAKYPGGTALRLAMVEDVLHEHFPRHGEAWYEARNTEARNLIDAAAERLAAGEAPSDAWLDACDDLAVGLMHAGRDDDAVAVMRRKLELLPRRGPVPAPVVAVRSEQMLLDTVELDRFRQRPVLNEVAGHWYSAKANLATALLHRHLPSFLRGDAEAGAGVDEGLAHLRSAMAINPVAHFGRETWQLTTAVHLQQVARNSTLLRQRDLIGQPLANIPIGTTALIQGAVHAYADGKMVESLLVLLASNPVEGGLPFLDRPGNDAMRLAIRRLIRPVGPDGSEPRWSEDGRLADGHVPFDEPVLGILGMWMHGGGANPHFALALGGVLERIGQRRLAVHAYERAVELVDRFSPNYDDRAWLVSHCQARQRALADSINQRGAAAWLAAERDLCRIALTEGRQMQAELHRRESALLAAGERPESASIRSLHTAPGWATAPGFADDVVIDQDRGHANDWSQPRPGERLVGGAYLAWIVLLAGLGAWCGVLVGWLFIRDPPPPRP
ncbi:hypothetical protein LBMAG53_30450 [Planctomycetota bacterium]|nr:hypothetical protein LBMAG53_30450 [Planctomycetota bacterium]